MLTARFAQSASQPSAQHEASSAQTHASQPQPPQPYAPPPQQQPVVYDENDIEIPTFLRKRR